MATARGFDDPEFQAAWIATSYAAGMRGERLLDAFEPPTQRAVALERALGSADRTERARALSAELTGLVRALEARRLA